MNGKVVITSKEDRVIEGCIGGLKSIETKANYIVWTFHNEDSAIQAARVFMNCNFEYVKRV